MAKSSYVHTDGWSLEVSRVVEGRGAEGWFLALPEPDGRDMPDADLDALAEAMLAGLGRRLADEQG